MHLTLSDVLDGVALADHDFVNILGMTRPDAEALRDKLVEAEHLPVDGRLVYLPS